MLGLSARINYKIHSILNYCALIFLLLIIFLYISTIYHTNPMNISILHFFSMDYFFWIVYIPIICIINRNDLMNKNYFEIARMQNKNHRFYLNLSSIMLTTIVLNIFVFSFSVVIEILVRHKFTSSILLFIYLLIRYCLLSILIQFSIYFLINIFMKSKIKNIFSMIPFIIFLIYIFPYEMLDRFFGLVVTFINFTAGGLYNIVSNDVSILDLLFGNLNIIAFTIFWFLVYKWFYLEREEYPNYEI